VFKFISAGNVIICINILKRLLTIHLNTAIIHPMRRSSIPFMTRLSILLRKSIQWLKPGLGIKRWLVVILAGTTLVGLGFAVLVIDLYRNAPDNAFLPIITALSLRFLARPLRALIFGGSGLVMILVGIWGLNRALLRPFMRPGKNLIDSVTAYRKRDKGPRIVVIGGGTGLAALLRGLKQYSANITAIVTVADDGGSSGELRKTMGVLPPGDIRNCLAALSSDEELLTQLFQYRFAAGAGLNGHTLGNLLITALTDITGSFEDAIAETGRVLAVTGQVLPSTLHDVRLVAEVSTPDKQIIVKGESEIPLAAGRVQRVWLEPSNPLAFPPALQAILAADLIIVGPGSLFTSILPNLLVPDVADALRATRAFKFYVCNVATQPGETDGFSCADHIRTLEKHLGGRIFDIIVCNFNFKGKLPRSVEWVKPDTNLEEMYPAYFADLLDEQTPWRHDSQKLAKSLVDLYNERTGPLASREEV
jgi:uncharacterized cofD-like protein